MALARAMAARLAVTGRLRVELERGTAWPAVLGRVDLGLLDPAPAPAVAADGTCRAVLAGEVHGVPAGARGLLEAYRTHGERAFHGLAGSFAFALWDAVARRLFLVNDRFGLRNVYYAASRDRFVFAPLVAALLEDPSLPRHLDPQATAEFVVFQCVLGDRTLLDDVRLLPPASILVFEPGRGVRMRETWQLAYRPRRRTLAEHAGVLADALTDATRRLAAAGGFRVGLPLSGGLDSRTLLAALGPAARAMPLVTYGAPGSDDVVLARKLARIAGAPHHVIPLAPGYVAAEVETMVARTDGMHSCLNAHAAVLREAGRFCDLVLLGNGGDCLLDGLWPGPEDGPEEALAARLLDKLAIGMPPGLAAEVVAPGAPFADVAARAATSLRAALANAPGGSFADRADAFNVACRHRRWVLQGVPAQATHVEFRHPYYDPLFVGAALEVPARLRAERVVHVAALARLSPALARVRQQGRPFGFLAPPWRRAVHRASTRVRDAVRWRANRFGLNPLLGRRDRRAFSDYHDELRNGSRALLDELVADRTLGRGFWRPDALRRLVLDHATGRANLAHALGVVLTLELFARAVLDGPSAAATEIEAVAARGADVGVL